MNFTVTVGTMDWITLDQNWEQKLILLTTVTKVVYIMRMFMTSCATDGVSRSKLLNVVVYYYYCYHHPFRHIIKKLLILNGCNQL